MSTLKPFYYGRFQKFAVLLLFALLPITAAFAQQPVMAQQTLASTTPITRSAPATDTPDPAIDPSKYGTFIKNEKGEEVGYISKRGTAVIHVGDKIMLTVGGRMDGKFFNIRYTPINGHNILNADSQHLDNEYANQTFVVTKVKNVRNGLINPRAPYAYIKLPGALNGYAEIEIEPALAQNEFQVVK